MKTLKEQVLELSTYELNELLDSIEESQGNIAIRWNVLDVKFRGQDLNLIVPDDVAMDILKSVKHNHDATVGVSWEMFDCYLWDAKQEGRLVEVSDETIVFAIDSDGNVCEEVFEEVSGDGIDIFATREDAQKYLESKKS